MLPHTVAYLLCPLGGEKLLLTSNYLHKNEHDEAHQADNQANMQNTNKGTPGVNRQYSQVHGNRGAQLNPNRPQGKK